MMMAPAMKVLERTNWRSVSWRATRAACRSMAGATALIVSFGGRVTDPWGQQRVEDVRDQRGAEIHEADDKGAALGHGEVLVEGSGGDALGDAVVVGQAVGPDK